MHPAYGFVSENQTWYVMWGWKSKPLRTCLTWNDRTNCKNLHGKSEKLQQLNGEKKSQIRKFNPKAALALSDRAARALLHVPMYCWWQKVRCELVLSGTTWQNLPCSTWKPGQPTPAYPDRLSWRRDFIALNKNISITLGLLRLDCLSKTVGVPSAISWKPTKQKETLGCVPATSLTTEPADRIRSKSYF